MRYEDGGVRGNRLATLELLLNDADKAVRLGDLEVWREAICDLKGYR